VTPVQWAGSKDLHEVSPINGSDYACLAEIRDVLRKHRKQDRFGVALLHKHFDLDKDEVLMESSDPRSRVLTIKPTRRAEIGETIATMWMLRDGDHEHMLDCQQHCALSGHPET